MRLADNCTGEDIVAAIEAEAARRGVKATALVRNLSSDPWRWLAQTGRAKSPRLATIARVRALIDGELVPPPPANNFQSTKRRRNFVRRVAGPDLPAASASTPKPAPLEPSRPAALRAEVFAETADARYRRWVAQSTGSVAHPLPVDRPAEVEHFAPAGDDRRPFAAGREPCPRCGARGDLGCRHQRPDPDLIPVQGLDLP